MIRIDMLSIWASQPSRDFHWASWGREHPPRRLSFARGVSISFVSDHFGGMGKRRRPGGTDAVFLGDRHLPQSTSRLEDLEI